MMTRTSVKIIASAIIFARIARQYTNKDDDIDMAVKLASDICDSVDAREERDAPSWTKTARAILMDDSNDPDALLSEE